MYDNYYSGCHNGYYDGYRGCHGYGPRYDRCNFRVYDRHHDCDERFTGFSYGAPYGCGFSSYGKFHDDCCRCW